MTRGASPTLVPALAQDGAAHVTMLQRTPTYVLSVPSVDRLAVGLRRVMGDRASYVANRWRAIGVSMGLYEFSQRRPGAARRFIRRVNTKLLPEGYDVDTHFNPPYDPWDQRMCLVPDSDLFTEISTGRAEVVTGHIERFTPSGVLLTDGRELEADVIVTATGLKLQLASDIAFSVDGEARDLSKTLSYRGMMFSDMPNLS